MKPRTRTLLLVLLGIGLAACARQAREPRVPEATATLAQAPPAWRPGDRWSFAWESGGNQGTKHAEVLAVRDLRAVRYYVVRIGELDHYFTPDLHWAGSVRDSVVEARMVPPQQWFVWPLAVGRQWVHRGVYEARGETGPRVYGFSVAGVETVEVPAGRFRGVKVVLDESSAEADQYWYVPEVKWYVRWIGRRGDVRFEERLVAWAPAAGLSGAERHLSGPPDRSSPAR